MGLFHALRRASSWDEVFDLISANGYTLIPNEEDLIAADMSTGLIFSIWDCGHSRLVFEESIRLGNDIQVIATKGANGTVRLAFKARKEVKIYHEDIYQRIQNEKHPDHIVHRATWLGIAAEDGNLWPSKKGVSL